MSAPRRLLILGNSHAAALQAGLRRLGDAAPAGVRVLLLGTGAHQFQPFSAPAEGGVRLTDPHYAEVVRGRFGDDVLPRFDIYGVCMGTLLPRLAHPSFWADAAPAWMADRARRPVSAGFIDALVAETQAPVRAFVAQLAATGARVAVIAGPPFRRDHVIFRHMPAAIVHAIEERVRGGLRDHARACGGDYVGAPEELVDDEGFLLPGYSQLHLRDGRHDPHHANEAYGEVMMAKVLARLGLGSDAAAAGRAAPSAWTPPGDGSMSRAMTGSGTDDGTKRPRAARLAEALRANLRRRKEQARARSEDGQDDAPAEDSQAAQGDKDAG